MIKLIKLILSTIKEIKIKRFTLKKEFLLVVNIIISAIILHSVTNAIILLITADEDFFQNNFIKHGLKYSPLLFSLWVAAGEIVCFNLYTALMIIDFYSLNSLKTRKWIDQWHEIANYLLFAVVFPLSLTVLLVFWGFYFYNCQAIYPEVVRSVLTKQLNHVCHTLPPLGAVYFIATSNTRAPSKSRTRLGLIIFLLFYGICITTIKIWHGKWVYLAFEALSTVQMVFFLASCLLGSIIFHELGYAIKDFFFCEFNNREINISSATVQKQETL